jgi:A/G-specific adenine glycosylase
VLDGNVMRVLTRILAMRDDIARPQTRAKLQKFANEFLDRNDPSSHNQAVMELGATVCLPRKPMCLICPLREECRGRDHAEDFPVKSRTAQVKREEVIAIIRHKNTFYCEQVSEGKPWHGLWRFPDFDAVCMEQGERIALTKYGITKYSVTMEAVAAKWKGDAVQPVAGRYCTSAEMRSLAFAAPHRKLIAMLEPSRGANSII